MLNLADLGLRWTPLVLYVTRGSFETSRGWLLQSFIALCGKQSQYLKLAVLYILC